ncbi:MAG: Glutathione S-transferase protein [Myxococcales bacterium]|nr:Glutathione S-transferase protein [Myxococcales bacterium]
MKLYGTTTSPFVRRVRVIAHEVGEPIDRLDTAPDEGQAALREVSPIRRVPVAVVDGRTIFDSRAIIEWLTITHGWHDVSPPRDKWRDLNIVNAIDAALDAVIQLFYLRRDGVAIDGTPYAQRQLDRADAIFAWLGKQLGADGKSFESGLGVAEISLVCALDWMDFRNAYPTKRAGIVESVREAWRDRPSLAASRPHA